MCSWLKTLVPLAAVLIVLGAGTASAQDLYGLDSFIVASPRED
jgi:hypothetical protein